MIRTLLFTLCMYAVTMSSALAICFEPSPPFGGPPTAPYCSLTSTGFDRCDSWEVDSFRSEVDDYIREMNRYLDEAGDYAQCQINEAVDNWNNFAQGY